MLACQVTACGEDEREMPTLCSIGRTPQTLLAVQRSLRHCAAPTVCLTSILRSPDARRRRLFIVPTVCLSLGCPPPHDPGPRLASALRVLYVVDPYGTEGLYSELGSLVFLLRLPQLMWVAAIVNLAFVWWFIAALVTPRAGRSSTRILYIALITCVVGAFESFDLRVRS